MRVLGMSLCIVVAGWAGPVAAQGMEWVYTSWTPVPGEPPSISLDYGVAYTDIVQFSLNCNAGSAGSTADVDFFSNTGAMPHGSPVTVSVVSTGQGPLQIPAQVFAWETGHTGARVELPMSHPFFAVLQNGSGLSFQLAGQQGIALPTGAGRGDITRFVNECSALSPNTPPANPAAPLSCDSYGNARSLSGEVPQQVTFSNTSNAARVLFWIDYEGQPTQIAIVEPGLWVTIDSYLTHPWLITDMEGMCQDVMVPQAGQDRYDIPN
ncbi:hypothetical protein [Nioella sp.]|uniref:VHL beta domain-containing protein n=1 Tax=Nioella sp. TaxID=1912091 RepID=UPI003B529053